MGLKFGQLYHLRNIIYVRISSYEVNPYKNFFPKMLTGMKRNLINYWGLAFAAYFTTHATIHVLDTMNDRFSRKQPGQFDNETFDEED